MEDTLTLRRPFLLGHARIVSDYDDLRRIDDLRGLGKKPVCEIACVFAENFRQFHACSAADDIPCHFFSSGSSETLKVFPSGSLNQATFAPDGEVQMPSSS